MKIILKSTDEADDKKLITFFIGYFLISAMNLLVKITLSGLPGWGVITKGILAILLLVALRAILKRALLLFMVMEMLMIFLFAISYIRGYSANIPLLTMAFNVCVVFIPMGISVFAIRNNQRFLELLYVWAWPTIVILSLIFIGFLNKSDSEYMMSFGYACLFQLLIIIDHFFANKKAIDMVASAYLIFVLLSCGSRGPVICLAVYFVLKIVFLNGVSKLKRLLISSVTLVVAIIFVKNYVSVFVVLNSLLTKLNIHSRSIQLIINDVKYDSGRTSLFSYYFDLIDKKPVLGWGIAGGWMDEGNYPHNLYIELLLSFGYVFGWIAFILIIALLMKGLLKKDISGQRIAHIFIGYFVCLMFSGSFVTTPLFFPTLMICIKNNSCSKGNLLT